MKPRLASARRGESSLLDLVVILAAVMIVGIVLILPSLAKSKPHSSKINCANNLKQIGLSFRMWAQDNGDKMPAQVSTNAGGTRELVAGGAVFPHFAVMSNELGTPKILVCPADMKRRFATNFSTSLSDANISYFVVPEADEAMPQLWLSGDRHLATNGVPLKPGLFTMATNRVLSWTVALHGNQGYLVVADSSVQQLSDAQLRASASSAFGAGLAGTNALFRLIIP
jgi:hypothetical protein